LKLRSFIFYSAVLSNLGEDNLRTAANVFSDEDTSRLTGHVSQYNFIIWGNNNPYGVTASTRDSQSQGCALYRQSVFVLLVVVEQSVVTGRGSVRSTRGLGPTMTARGQSIGISLSMLPQTLIMSRLDQLSRLGARI